MGWGWLKKAGRGVWSGVRFFIPFFVSAGLDKIKEKNPKYAWLLDAIDDAVQESQRNGWPVDQESIARAVLKTHPTAKIALTRNLVGEYFKHKNPN